MNLVLYVLIFTFLGSILSLAGGLFFYEKKLWEGENSVHLFVFRCWCSFSHCFSRSFARGLKLNQNSNPNILLQPCFGWLCFLFRKDFDKFSSHNDAQTLKARRKAVVNLILFGDGFHNFIDGFKIASSFLVSIPLGIVTSLAVAAHEIPQEISDFTILLKGDIGPKKQLFSIFCLV